LPLNGRSPPQAQRDALGNVHAETSLRERGYVLHRLSQHPDKRLGATSRNSLFFW
jgi:hypothetical protein